MHIFIVLVYELSLLFADMKEVERKVRTITCDGLVWGAGE